MANTQVQLGFKPFGRVPSIVPTGGLGLTAEARHAEPLLDVDAVATRLGVSSKTVRRLIDRGELAVHRIGRLLRVSEPDLHNYVARRRQIQSKEVP
jgi:excisionase family DNA binding protein